MTDVPRTAEHPGDSQTASRRPLAFALKLASSLGVALALALSAPSDAFAAKKRSKSKSTKKTVVIAPQKSRHLSVKEQGAQGGIIRAIRDAANRGALSNAVSRAKVQGYINNNFMLAMLKCLDDGGFRERHNCAYALSITVDPRFTIVMPHLVLTLQTADESEIRMHAAKALGRLGPAGIKVAPSLAEALSDKTAPTRREAATALGKMKAVKFAPQVLEIALNDDEVTETRQAAIIALGEMRYQAAVPKLTELMNGGREVLRLTAARSLCLMEHPSGRAFAEQLIKSTDEYQRKDAVWLLHDIAKSWSSDLLAKLLLDSSVTVQIEAGKALSLMNDSRGMKWLVIRAKMALDNNEFELSNRLEQAIEDAKIPSKKRKAILAEEEKRHPSKKKGQHP